MTTRYVHRLIQYYVTQGSTVHRVGSLSLVSSYSYLAGDTPYLLSRYLNIQKQKKGVSSGRNDDPDRTAGRTSPRRTLERPNFCAAEYGAVALPPRDFLASVWRAGLWHGLRLLGLDIYPASRATALPPRRSNRRPSGETPG